MKVRIISTARAITREELGFSIDMLKEWGMQVELGKSIGSIENQYAGADNLRREDLQMALDDPTLDCILFARGGYGTARLLDGIDYSKFIQHPKVLLGYSDLTALFLDVYAKTSCMAIHGPMPVGWEKNTHESLAITYNLLKGDGMNYEFESSKDNRLGIAEGVLLGGNLSVLYSVLGSDSEPDWTGKILFLEDLDEYYYHLDRMLLAIKRRGMLSKLRGIVVGGFTEIKDNTIPFGKNHIEIIQDHCAEYGFPMAFHFSGGHLLDNRPLKLGVKVKLEVDDAKVRLTEQLES